MRELLRRKIMDTPLRASDSTTRKLETIVNQLSPQECRELLKRMSSLEQNSRSGGSALVKLDVRSAEEYRSGHIPGAINIDYRSPSFEDQLAGLDREKAHLVYCRTGVRSQKALPIMKRLGFSEIYNLTKGIAEWQREGGEIVSIPES
jgi:rhodanese-related sulfurtransferase